MENEESNYSPYCELCGACGEDGCCSHISCFSKLIENPQCKYGETYLKDVILNKNVVNMIFELVEKLEKDKAYTKDMFIKDFNSRYDKYLDERY